MNINVYITEQEIKIGVPSSNPSAYLIPSGSKMRFVDRFRNVVEVVEMLNSANELE